MGADACHHAGVLRPTSKLHRHIPCPGELLAATRFSVSPTHIHNPGSEFRGEKFDLASRTTPLLDIVENGFFEDPATAQDSIHKIGDFDANSMCSSFWRMMNLSDRPYPTSLDQWQAKGWKEKTIWAFP
ncbi:hypothetical protein K438DRAFT_1721843 [Mycena galopus ATCC 62051]|nr:hypothetical protein K438DRAFT_1721843 [Mycena galopus ATCC 62051]